LSYVGRDSLGVLSAEIYTLPTHETQRILLPGTKFHRLFLNWSPQGDAFAYADASAFYPAGTSATLWILTLTDRTGSPVTKRQFYDFCPSWSSDGGTLFFISNRGGTMDLWQVALDNRQKPKGKSIQVTHGLGLRSAAFSPDGSKLAYSKGGLTANIWRIPVTDSSEKPLAWETAQQLTFERAYIKHVDISSAGKRIFFNSNRAGNSELWSMRTDGSDLKQLTTTSTGGSTAPRLSPDGHTLLFASGRSGIQELWTMPSEGGPATQVTHDQSTKFYPAWSPDGRRIAYMAQDSTDVLDLWVIPAQGGQARQITTGPVQELVPLWSPDGKWLVFAASEDDDTRIWRAPIEGGQSEPLMEPGINTAADQLAWSPDGTQLYFLRWLEGRKNVWSLSVADGSVKQLTDLQGRYGNLGRYLATDDQYLYFIWEEDLGDIWVMDVEK
jgi:TolB protein